MFWKSFSEALRFLNRKDLGGGNYQSLIQMHVVQKPIGTNFLQPSFEGNFVLFEREHISYTDMRWW